MGRCTKYAAAETSAAVSFMKFVIPRYLLYNRFTGSKRFPVFTKKGKDVNKLQRLKTLAEEAARELRNPSRGKEFPELGKLAVFISEMDLDNDFGNSNTSVHEYWDTVTRAMEEDTHFLGGSVSSWLPNIGELAGIICEHGLSDSNRKNLERTVLRFCDALDILPVAS